LNDDNLQFDAPLLNVMIIPRNYSDLGTVQLNGLVVQRFDIEYDLKLSKFDLTLIVETTSSGKLNIVFEYSTDLFEAHTIQSMTEQFIVLLKSVVNNPNQNIHSLSTNLQCYGDNKSSFALEIKNVSTCSFVQIQKGKKGNAPIFFLHHISDPINSFADLAMELGPDHPVIVFQSQSIVEQIEPYHDIELIASDYVAELLCQFPTMSSFIIGGYSFGGVLAYEIAQKLKFKGYEVPLLIMIDSAGPISPEMKQTIFIEAENKNKGLDQSKRQLTLDSHLDCLTEYKYEAYRGKVIFFTACNIAKYSGFHKWPFLLQCDLTIYSIPGDHYSMIKLPCSIKKIAKLLLHALSEIDTEEEISD